MKLYLEAVHKVYKTGETGQRLPTRYAINGLEVCLEMNPFSPQGFGGFVQL